MKQLCLLLCLTFTLPSPALALRMESVLQSAGAEELKQRLAGTEEQPKTVRFPFPVSHLSLSMGGARLFGAGPQGGAIELLPIDKTRRIWPYSGQPKITETGLFGATSATVEGPVAEFRHFLSGIPRNRFVYPGEICVDAKSNFAFPWQYPPKEGYLAVALADRAEVIHIETKTGKEIRLWTYRPASNNPPITSVSLSADGQMLAAGFGTSQLVLAKRATQGGYAQKVFEHGQPVTDFALTPHLLAGVQLAAAAGKEVTLWDTALKKEPVKLSHDAPVAKISFSPDGKMLASSTTVGDTIILWDSHTGEKLATLPSQKPATDIAFSLNGSRIAVANGGPEASVWATPPAVLARMSPIQRPFEYPAGWEVYRNATLPSGILTQIGLEPTQWLRRLDGKERPAVYGIRSGVAFGHKKTWWSTQADRPGPHSGVDLLLRRTPVGNFNPVPEGMGIPIMFDGQVVLLFEDTMQSTVVVETAHEDPVTGERLYIVYTHVEIDRETKTDWLEKIKRGEAVYVKTTDKILRIQRSRNPKSVVAAHLHLGIQTMKQSDRIRLWGEGTYITDNRDFYPEMDKLVEVTYHNPLQLFEMEDVDSRFVEIPERRIEAILIFHQVDQGDPDWGSLRKPLGDRFPTVRTPGAKSWERAKTLLENPDERIDVVIVNRPENRARIFETFGNKYIVLLQEGPPDQAALETLDQINHAGIYFNLPLDFYFSDPAGPAGAILPRRVPLSNLLRSHGIRTMGDLVGLVASPQKPTGFNLGFEDRLRWEMVSIAASIAPEMVPIEELLPPQLVFPAPSTLTYPRLFRRLGYETSQFDIHVSIRNLAELIDFYRNEGTADRIKQVLSEPQNRQILTVVASIRPDSIPTRTFASFFDPGVAVETLETLGEDAEQLVQRAVKSSSALAQAVPELEKRAQVLLALFELAPWVSALQTQLSTSEYAGIVQGSPELASRLKIAEERAANFSHPASAGTEEKDGFARTERPAPINQLIFDAQSSRFAAADLKGRIRSWELATGKELESVEVGVPLTDSREIFFDPEGNLDFKPDAGGWSAAGASAAGDQTESPPLHAASALKGLRQGYFSAIKDQDGGIELIERRAGRLSQPKHSTVRPGFNATALALSRDGRWLVAGGREGTLLFRYFTGKSTRIEEPAAGNKGEITHLAFSPDGNFLATGDSLGGVTVWPLQEGGEVGAPVFRSNGHPPVADTEETAEEKTAEFELYTNAEISYDQVKRWLRVYPLDQLEFRKNPSHQRAVSTHLFNSSYPAAGQDFGDLFAESTLLHLGDTRTQRTYSIRIVANYKGLPDYLYAEVVANPSKPDAAGAEELSARIIQEKDRGIDPKLWEGLAIDKKTVVLYGGLGRLGERFLRDGWNELLRQSPFELDLIAVDLLDPDDPALNPEESERLRELIRKRMVEVGLPFIAYFPLKAFEKAVQGDGTVLVNGQRVRIDGVIPAVFTRDHLPLAEPWIRRGVPVWMDKPIVKIEEVDRIRQLARDHPKTVMGVDFFLYSDALLWLMQEGRAAQLLRDIGEIRRIDGRCCESWGLEGENRRWLMDPSLSGGTGLDIDTTVHPLAMMEPLIQALGSLLGKDLSLKEAQIGRVVRGRYVDPANGQPAPGTGETYFWMEGRLDGIPLYVDGGKGVDTFYYGITITGSRGSVEVFVGTGEYDPYVKVTRSDGSVELHTFPGGSLGYRNIWLDFLLLLHGSDKSVGGDLAMRLAATTASVELIGKAERYAETHGILPVEHPKGQAPAVPEKVLGQVFSGMSKKSGPGDLFQNIAAQTGAEEANLATAAKIVLGPSALERVPGLRQALELLKRAGAEERFILLPEQTLPPEEFRAGLVEAAARAYEAGSLIGYASREDAAMAGFEELLKPGKVSLVVREPVALRFMLPRILQEIGLTTAQSEATTQEILAAAGLEQAA